jgi:transposase InsO family protein
MNIADGITRGQFPDDLKNLESHPYFEGPEFLYQDPETWPKIPNQLRPFDPSEELKVQPKVMMNVEAVPVSFAELYFKKFGTRIKLMLFVAWQRRFLEFLRSKSGCPVGPITNQEKELAELKFIQLVQRERFSDIIDRLERQTTIPQKYPIAKYDPILVNNLLRIEGRLEHAPDVPYDVRHPLVLPERGHVTELIINHVHEDLLHASVRNTVNELRSRFWIPEFHRAVKIVLNRCIVCKRRDAPFAGQMMANLPPQRLQTFHNPFEVAGADLFGIFFVRIGRSLHKRYVAIFACLSSRAVHLEPVASLEADSFILAVRRLQARRGQIKELRVDNATNNKASDKQMSEAISEWNLSQVGSKLQQLGIQFSYNTPRASHMGGAFEAMIRLVRRPLRLALEEQVLTDEGLQTFTAEAEAIVNSRPLTAVSDDPQDYKALTPADLLVIRPPVPLPPGIFSERDLLRRKWKQVQHLANIFWNRYLKEYLPLLNKRQKWLVPKPNLRVGDLVLMHEDNVPRGAWPLARVTQVRKSSDDLVRTIVLRTKNGEYKRPIHKVVLLETSGTD